MNVLCVYPQTIPAHSADSVQIMKMCQGFQKAGHTVTLYAPRARQFDGNIGRLWELYGISQPFSIALIDSIPWLRGHDLALRALNVARTQPTDILYTRHLPTAMWASHFDIPNVLDLHEPPGKRMGSIYLRIALSGSGFKRLIVITKPLKQAYRMKFGDHLPENQVLVDPNGVDLEDFSDLLGPEPAREQLGLMPKFTIGYIGHMYPGRGVEFILWLATQFPHFQFLLAGGTQYDIDRMKTLASQQNLENIVFLGFLPNRTLPLVCAACDVLLMPYQRKVAVFGGKGDSSEYMSPMKMFEYMASRRIIISSDLPVIREILNESNAVLCDPENTAEWREAIQRSATDFIWSVRIAQQARADVEMHTWEMRAKRALDGIL